MRKATQSDKIQVVLPCINEEGTKGKGNEKIHTVGYEIYSETLIKLNMKGPKTHFYVPSPDNSGCPVPLHTECKKISSSQF